MRKIDWSEAPEGDVRYCRVFDAWLEKKPDGIYYTRLTNGERYKGADQSDAKRHWNDATPRPEATPTRVGVMSDGKEVTLVAANDSDYTPTDVDSTITQRGERYGKFKDGSVIMQDLKNVMRGTPNWEGLSPSQRESLEMIQHKIGRILNGDPMYDDNWRDICGYSQLVLDELNGTVR